MSVQRAIIFANGILEDPQAARRLIRPDDLLIAADGGARHCRAMGVTPHVLIGDFDSLDEAELAFFEQARVQILRHPAHKDFTDLELALLHARDQNVGEVLVLAGLGARWDQTLANLLLPAAEHLRHLRIRLIDGQQEVMLLRSGATLEVAGQAGDTVSLIPLGGDAHGITTQGLEYPLADEILFFGTTRGVSNVLLGETARIYLREGLLLCVVIHNATS